MGIISAEHSARLPGYSVAVEITDRRDLVALFSLMLRSGDLKAWELSKVIVPPLDTGWDSWEALEYPSACVSCKGIFSGSSNQLFFGCSQCKRKVSRGEFYPHVLERQLPYQVLDYCMAWAIWYCAGRGNYAGYN